MDKIIELNKGIVTQFFLLLYTIPSIGLIFDPSLPINDWGWIAVLVGGVGYTASAYTRDWSTFDKPSSPSEDLSTIDIEIILKEYEELGEAFRYKDLLMTRSLYLSITVTGVLATVITQIDTGEAFIAMVGSLITFGFVVSIASHKESREQINDRRLELEKHPSLKSKLTLVKSGTIRERPFFSNFSASEFIRNFHIFTLILWIGAYLYFVIFS